VYISIQCLPLGFRSSAGIMELTKHAQACVSELFGRPARGHFGVTSARGHFGVTCLEKIWFGVTSGSLRGHLARENSAQSHAAVEKTRENSAGSRFKAGKTEKTRLEATSRWTFPGLTKHAQACVSELFGRPARPELGSGSPRTRLRVTSESLVSRRLGSGSFRGHFGVTWLEKPRLEVTSRSRKLEKTRLEVIAKSRKLRKLGSKSLAGGHFRAHKTCTGVCF